MKKILAQFSDRWTNDTRFRSRSEAGWLGIMTLIFLVSVVWNIAMVWSRDYQIAQLKEKIQVLEGDIDSANGTYVKLMATLPYLNDDEREWATWPSSSTSSAMADLVYKTVATSTKRLQAQADNSYYEDRAKELQEGLKEAELALRADFHLLKGDNAWARFYAREYARQTTENVGVQDTYLRLSDQFLDLLAPYYSYERGEGEGGPMIIIKRVYNP